MKQAPQPPPLGLRLRPGAAADLERVGQIQAQSPSASQWDPAAYLTYEFRVAEVEGRVVGFSVSRRVTEGETELLNLAVDPAWRRRGIGARLLRELLEPGSGEVYLEFRESQSGTRKFYEINGFRQVGYRPGYYLDPPEGAVVMKISSC